MSVSDWAIPAYVVLTLVVGLASRVDVYESFVKGAAEALPIMRRVLPYTCLLYTSLLPLPMIIITIIYTNLAPPGFLGVTRP